MREYKFKEKSLRDTSKSILRFILGSIGIELEDKDKKDFIGEIKRLILSIDNASVASKTILNVVLGSNGILIDDEAKNELIGTIEILINSIEKEIDEATDSPKPVEVVGYIPIRPVEQRINDSEGVQPKREKKADTSTIRVIKPSPIPAPPSPRVLHASPIILPKPGKLETDVVKRSRYRGVQSDKSRTKKESKNGKGNSFNNNLR